MQECDGIQQELLLRLTAFFPLPLTCFQASKFSSLPSFPAHHATRRGSPQIIAGEGVLLYAALPSLIRYILSCPYTPESLFNSQPSGKKGCPESRPRPQALCSPLPQGR